MQSTCMLPHLLQFPQIPQNHAMPSFKEKIVRIFGSEQALKNATFL